MYFLNANKLKQSLLNEPLTQKEAFKYLIALIILINISPLLPSEKNSEWHHLIFVLQTIITIIGTYYSFIANNKNDGQYFLQRYLSLSFVLYVRYGLLCILFFIPIVLILRNLNFDEYSLLIIADIYVCFVALFVYYNLVKYISEIASYNKLNT